MVGSLTNLSFPCLALQGRRDSTPNRRFWDRDSTNELRPYGDLRPEVNGRFVDRPLVSRQATAQRRGHLRPRYANPPTGRPAHRVRPRYIYGSSRISRRIGESPNPRPWPLTRRPEALKAAGRPGDRLRRRGAGFHPTTSCRRPNSLATTPPCTATPRRRTPALREAIAAKTARLRLRGHRRAGPGDQRWKQALYNVRRAARSRRRGLLPAPYWTTYRSRSSWPGRTGVIPTDEDTGYKVSVAALDERAVTANQTAGLRPRPTRLAPSTPR